MVLRLLLLLALSSSAWAVGPTCPQAPNLACAVTPGAIGTVVSTCGAGQIVDGINSSGNLLCVNDPSAPVVTSYAGIDCTGATDSSVGWNANVVPALTGTGLTVVLPPGCVLRAKSPGAGNAAFTIPNDAHIYCADPSAGFAVNHQHCVANVGSPQYIGAACVTNAECTQIGGGAGIAHSCQDDFGHDGTSPCTSTTCFAPTTSPDVYTLMKDQNAQSSDINIENCSFWTYQADPYQRCVSGGAHNGAPCRQECDNNSFVPGSKCETSADTQCAFGHVSAVCLRTSDCHADAGPGLCGGAPHNGSGVAGSKINPIDFTRTFNAIFRNVSIYDHFSGDFGLKVGGQLTAYDVNAAREIFDCSSPIPATPSASACFTTSAAQCCYGAANNGSTSNVQPTVSVTNDINVGNNSQLLRCYGRGSTTSFLGGTGVRIDESTVLPAGSYGPGTVANGFSIGGTSQVAKSFALDLIGSGTGVACTGDNCGVVANKLYFDSGASGGTGISMTGAQNHAIGNDIQGLTGAGIGIDMGGTQDEATGDNYVSGSMTTGEGIHMNGANQTVDSNVILSSPANQMQSGIQVEAVNLPIISSNQLTSMAKAAIWFHAAPFMARVNGNTSNLVAITPATQTTLHPVHVLSDSSAASQTTIDGNGFNGGWIGYSCGAVGVGALTNTGVSANRFYQMGGPPIACGGAGITLALNYVNATSAYAPTICDASCTGGTFAAGQICNQDSECGSCGASVDKCVPQALIGYVGSPFANNPVAHSLYFGNTAFAGTATLRQCSAGTGSPNTGQICQTTGNTCANGNTCTTSGGISTCTGGSAPDLGKLCCTGTTPTCAVRDPQPFWRVPDYGVAQNANSDLLINNNIIFNSTTPTNVTVLEMKSPGNVNLGHMALTGGMFAANDVNLNNVTAATGIDYNATGVTHFSVLNNNFYNLADANRLVNYYGSSGSLQLQNGRMTNGTVHTLGTITNITNFFPFDSVPQGSTDPPTAETTQKAVFSGGGTVWKFTCAVTTAPGGTGAGSIRAFTLRKNSSSTSMPTCNIQGAATTCTTNTNLPVTFLSTDEINWQTVSTVTGSLAGSDASCVAYVSHDTVM